MGKQLGVGVEKRLDFVLACVHLSGFFLLKRNIWNSVFMVCWLVVPRLCMLLKIEII